MIFPDPVSRPSLLSGFGRSQRRGLPPNVRETAAAALAAQIAEARQTAIAGGVRPIPSMISRSLLGYFPETLIRRCRHTVADAAPLRLPPFRLAYGNGASLTLSDVVIFRADRAAQSDLREWARALTHVMQFQRWGVADFARRWIDDRAAIEQEATANAARFLAWSREKAATARN